MRKIKIFFIVGTFAWCLQACNNNRDHDDTTNSQDSIYNDDKDNNNRNVTSPRADDTTNPMPIDTTGGRNINRTDTTGNIE